MTEKYKIYLSPETKGKLLQDAELFEFRKADNHINLNGFLKVLVANYFLSYRETQTRKHNTIARIARNAGINERASEEMADSILAELESISHNNDNSESITFTASGDSLKTIEIISSNFLLHTSLSEYIRNMFNSYLSSPRSEREKVIFKDQCESLNVAIKGRKLLSFKTTIDNKQYNVVPYSLAASSQEQFNYLLVYDVDAETVRSFRLSRIKSVYVHDKSYVLTSEITEVLKQSSDNNPAFIFKDAQMICVKFTEEGKRKFRMIYTNRPMLDHVEEDRYYFYWPLNQAKQYFIRFGKDALILEPSRLQDEMLTYYSEAGNVYKALSPQNE